MGKAVVELLSFCLADSRQAEDFAGKIASFSHAFPGSQVAASSVVFWRCLLHALQDALQSSSVILKLEQIPHSRPWAEGACVQPHKL